MDDFTRPSFPIRGPKPQFNIALFNHIISVTINKKMAGDLLLFIKASPDMLEDFEDLYEDLKVVLNEPEDHCLMHNKVGDYQVTKYRHMITINLEYECASVLGDFILAEASVCCNAVGTLSLPSFVAFGRRLRDAAAGNFTNVPNPNRGPVREIIIRKL